MLSARDENTIEERMLDTLAAKHDLAMAALDVKAMSARLTCKAVSKR